MDTGRLGPETALSPDCGVCLGWSIDFRPDLVLEDFFLPMLVVGNPFRSRTALWIGMWWGLLVLAPIDASDSTHEVEEVLKFACECVGV